MHRARLLALAFGAALALLPLRARADAWDPFPALPPKQAVALAPGLEPASYASLDACFKGLGQATGARYFAAVVQVTDARGRKDPSGNDAVPWVDELYRAWQANGRLDPATHLLIGLGLKNRAVAIHPGNRFADLGFVKDSIKATIDGSSFKTAARSGDYGLALCELARSTDARLSQLLREAELRRAYLSGKIQEGRGRLDALTPKSAALAPRYPKLAAAFTAELARAEDSLDLAAREVPRERQDSAGIAVNNAFAVIERLETQAAEVATAMVELPKRREVIEKEIARLRADTSRTFGAGVVAVGELERCRAKIDEIEGAFEVGRDPPHPVQAVDECLTRAAPSAGSARRAWFAATRVLPGTLGGLLAAAFGAWVFFRRRARAWALAEAAAEIEVWSSALENASTRLLALEQEHPIYFASGATPWTGKSRDVDQRSADAVNRAFLFFEEAQSLLTAARRLVGGAGPLAVPPLRDALALLRSAKVVFETGERETRRRIFLPLSERYEGTARDLLPALDSAYMLALELLDRRMALVDEAARRGEELDGAAGVAVAAVQAREALGLPVGHLTGPLGPALELQRVARAARIADPTSALETCAEAAPVLAEVSRRATLGNDLAKCLREVLGVRLVALEREVVRLRGAGFRLDEERLGPDPRAARLRRRLDEAVKHLAAGAEADADPVVQAALADLNRLEADLKTTEEARAGVPRAVAEIAAAASGLVARVPAARERLAALAGAHHPDAYLAESDNLEELRALLEVIADEQRHALAEHAAQSYLAAVAETDKLRGLVAAGDGLLSAIGAIEVRLLGIRDEARAIRGRCDGLVEQIEALGGAGALGGGRRAPPPSRRGQAGARRARRRDGPARAPLAAPGPGARRSGARARRRGGERERGDRGPAQGPSHRRADR